MLKSKRVYSGILALSALIAAIYIAIQYQISIDSPDEIFDEMVSIENGFKVRLVYPDSPEKGIIFFLADNTDANITTDYAKQFAELSYYVVVIDTNKLLTFNTDTSSQCIDIAQKLQEIQSSLSEKLDLDSDVLPILVGNNEGAALVYVALAQANGHSFHAGISINFTAQLHNIFNLCAAEEFVHPNADGTASLIPVERLSSTWYLFQEDKKIPPLAIQEFANQVANAKLTIHDEENATVISDVIQILSWLDPRLSDQLSSDESEGDLPIMEVTSDFDSPSQTFAIMITGDGGWAEIDKGIANALAKKGIPTVALDSLSYFWNRKTPNDSALAIEQLMTQYLTKWHKKNVILIGYSFGADVLPFIANRITAENRNSIALIVLLGVGKTAAFEFHLSSWMDADNSTGRLPVLPEIKQMSWANSICIYGSVDKEANCMPLKKMGVNVISMSGDHHFDNKYGAIAQHIIDNIRTN